MPFVYSTSVGRFSITNIASSSKSPNELDRSIFEVTIVARLSYPNNVQHHASIDNRYPARKEGGLSNLNSDAVDVYVDILVITEKGNVSRVDFF